KALDGFKKLNEPGSLSKVLTNLADLLQTQCQPADLAAARQYAEEALSIDQTLDPAAAEIWKTYTVLAKIAEKQGRTAEARTYRQQARQAKAAFAGTQYELRRHAPLIATAIAAVTGNAEVRQELEGSLAQFGAAYQKLAAAIRRILNGDRNEAAILDPLNYRDSMIVMAILRGIEDPASLSALLEAASE
ncbi:MAG: hypothetical protein F6J97_19975, partial [Leptolyngbya sp. SIO4C1]|nr:hypothetical protein [Leptolyngbya sp. SIO4C1]